MGKLFDPFREDMARIKRELEKLHGCKIHVGIMGDAGSDILTIAGVHEYGATIRAHDKKLTIPLDREAKGKSPSEFNDLDWIPGRNPGVSFLARKKKRRAKNKKSEGLSPSSDYNPDDYTWMYMLVDSVTIPERSFISTDLGQRGNPNPIDGMRTCIHELLNAGIPQKSIDLMVRSNPAHLIGLNQ